MKHLIALIYPNKKNLNMRVALIILSVLFSSFTYAQNIPTNKIISNEKLASFLTPDIQNKLTKDGIISTQKLALYLRNKFAQRYFFDWHTFDQRFQSYQQNYPLQRQRHQKRALAHMAKFPDTSQWQLPFNYLNGKEVNAYALRHLARQHKMVDIAFYYFYQNKKKEYISYFTKQLASLNNALVNDNYETIADGNGVYEAFRSGYRVLNWLQIHNMFLGEVHYSDQQQLITIATLLQHGAHLYKTNQQFLAGNHQTRGLSALAMISILLRDFAETSIWLEHSMTLLESHLDKEINDDGFQFERSVHYHISDINNYFYVYQLAKTSNIEVSAFWQEKLTSLFTTLTKIAYPDKTAPVLQDDTNKAWAEKNNISKALTLGYLVFQDPTMGYFANNFVDSKTFWLLNQTQLSSLDAITTQQPTFNSYAFPQTGYYIARDGWDKNDLMMIISAGVDKDKPDHQHGDILGVQAMANGKVVLPNYQVRYPLADLELFKNSMVKNVALVDDKLQGKKYTANKGGSGFGKFKQLPEPNVILWDSTNNADIFIGSHNGFEDIGVSYSRQVIQLKNDFWIVKDNFESSNRHDYKQVWQGHYTVENEQHLLRASFDDASGFDIFQINSIDKIQHSGARGKHWSIAIKNNSKKFSFITILFPYSGSSNRIDELTDTPNFNRWQLNKYPGKITGQKPTSLTKNNESYVFGVEKITFNNHSINFTKETDIYIKKEPNSLIIHLIGEDIVELASDSLEKETHENDSSNRKFIFKLN